MTVDIQQSIAAALASRHAQLEKAGRFERAWESLADSVDALIAAANEASAQFTSHRSLTPDELEIAQELDAARSLADLRTLRGKITAQAGNVTAIGNRIRRPTVNIGVIGRTQSGKSTFLRAITDIGYDVIPPADDLDPTTSARSRFRNSPGRSDAVIKLLTREEFLAEIVVPLHVGAGCPEPPPSTLEEFAGYPYRQRLAPSRDGRAPAPDPLEQSRLRLLRLAQGSLSSYLELLAGGERTIKNLADLRPYVAYPADEATARLYHAVRDVLVYCPFPEVDVKDLELIDLPGSGEAGLEVDRRFLYDLKNDVDVLLHFTRPRSGVSFFDSADNIGILRLADQATMGVDRGDFTCLVINEDATKPVTAEIANVLKGARTFAADNGYLLVNGDASDKVQAREKILGPVLAKLAERLEAMDAAAAADVTRSASAVANGAISAAGQLTSGANRWQVLLPSEDDALRIRAKKLRNDIADGLLKLAERYERDVRDGQPIPEVEQGIGQARERLAQWANTQFGGPGRKQWLAQFAKDHAGDPAETLDDWCTVVRQQLRREFSEVDGSLDRAIGQMRQDIAAVLRDSLRAGDLVPVGDQTFSVLVKELEQPGFRRMQAALADLMSFGSGYGNVFLRVGGPVVAQVTYGHAISAGSASLDPADRAAAVAILKDGGRKIAGAMTGPHASAAVPIAVAGTAIKLAPIVADIVWQAQLTDRSPEAFANALSDAFQRAVDLIAERMRAEALQLTQTLAAVVSQFYDGFCRTPEVEWEYARLCKPISRQLWPDLFNGSAARLSGGLSRLAAQATATTTAAHEVIAAASDLRTGR